MNKKTTLLVLSIALSGCQSMEPLGGGQSSLYGGGNSVLYQVQKQANSPEQAMRMGAAAYSAGAFDQALYQYLRAIELDPQNYDALVWVGRIHRERGNNNLAELAFSDVLQRQPDNVMALTEMGLLQLALRRQEDARERLGRALAVDQQRLGGSAAQTPAGLKVDSASPLKAYNGMGVLADLDNDFERAAQYYRLAKQIDPRSPLVANSQAYSAYLAGNWAEAETLYRQGIAFDGGYEPLWRNYGLLLARMGRYEQALSMFEQVEGRAEASNDVGYICLIEGKLEVAEQFFRSAIDQSPAHFEMAWENLRRVEQIRRLRQDGVGGEDSAIEAFAVVPSGKQQASP